MTETKDNPIDVAQTKLTKKGLPDKRSITSKQNMKKAQSKVKEIVAKAKTKVSLPVVEESSSDSDSDTEYAIRKVKQKDEKNVVNEDKDNVNMKMNELAKAMNELREENKSLRHSFVKTNHLHKINSLSQNMLMKF